MDRDSDLVIVEDWFRLVTSLYHADILVPRDKKAAFLADWTRTFRDASDAVAKVCVAYGVQPDCLIAASRSVGVGYLAPSKPPKLAGLSVDDLDRCGNLVAKLKLTIEAGAGVGGDEPAAGTNDCEAAIIQAVDEAASALRGQDLAAAAGYNYNSHFKATTASLVKRGLIDKSNKGYCPATRKSGPGQD